MLNPKDDFELPVFDRPMQDPPSTVPYEQAITAFEEFAKIFKIKEQPRTAEDTPEFKM